LILRMLYYNISLLKFMNGNKYENNKSNKVFYNNHFFK